jgi:hypothetical protein
VSHLMWKRQLLGVLGAAALGFAGAAWAQDTQQAGQDIEGELDDGTGGAGQQDPGAYDPGAYDPGAYDQGAYDEGAGSRGQEQPGTGGGAQQGTEQQGTAEQAGSTVGQTVDQATETVGKTATEAGRRAETLFEGRPDKREVRVTGEVGIQNWAGNIGRITNTGPQWGVSVDMQVFNLLGLEAGYNGQRNAITEGLGALPSSAIFRHALDALAKVGPTLENGLRPYGGVGFGLALIIPNQAADPNFYNDFIAELPVVVGVDYSTGLLTAGLRGSWRWTFGEEFAKPFIGPNGEGSIFGASLNFGGRF